MSTVYKTLSITMEYKPEGDKCLVEIHAVLYLHSFFLYFLASFSWTTLVLHGPSLFFIFEAISDNLEQN